MGNERQNQIMKIQKALKLKIGQRVVYPSDRGELQGIGVVKLVSKDIQTNSYGQQYV